MHVSLKHLTSSYRAINLIKGLAMCYKVLFKSVHTGFHSQLCLF